MINDLNLVQWDYLLSPEFELINSAGKPLTGGYIEVYIHGTRNKYYCASDWNGTLHPFQIPLDSIGSNVILASPENAYDVYVYNKYGSLIMSRYNVHCQGGNGGSSTYVGDKLYYGQYRARNVTTIANLTRNKGNINLSSDGYLKLKNGMSYHITVRGAFEVDNVANVDTTLNYIEYTSVNPIKIDIDETKEGPQYFELSYDIYRLPEDMDYQVAFDQANGMVTDLIVEVHSLSNLATSAAGGDQEYEPGWGIDITNNVISVDPSILDDYVTEEELLEIVTGITGIIPEDVATHTEVYEATVTAIEYVTGMIPSSQVQSNWDETDDTDPSYIQNKPDLSIYATHDEVNTVSGEIIETVNNVSSVLHEEITNNNETVIETINNVSGILHEEIIETAQVITGLIPDVSDFTTHEDVNSAIVTAIDLVTGMIPDAQVQSDWNQSDDTQPDYIKNKPDLDIYATHDEVNTVSGQIVEIVNNVSGDIIETVNNVSGDIIETVNNVSAILHGEIENIPEQQQADWDQTDDTKVDYIKNKPDLSIYATHDEVTAAVSSIDLSEYATHTEVYDSSVTAIQLVTSLIPDVSDFTTHDEVHESIVSALEYVTGIIPDAQVQSDWTETDTSDPAYIKHKPNQTELVAGQNIGIFDNGSTLTIAASGTDLTGYATETEVNSAIVTAINYVTGIIPDAQVQSNWEETDNTDPSYIQNKPDLSVYMTEEQVMEIVTGVTGLTEYGQFYATAVSGAATMSRTKGTIDVTNDGKIKLKQGSSYHVTVRGRYNQTTPNNVYSNISYIEYITNNSIHVNVDKTITESQYFEISYDLYKLNSDSNYYVFFSGLEGTVNDLFIEIHALGGIGGNGGSVTGAAEYDAGWGIQILNNVISVNPSIIPDDINLVAGQNIGIMVSGNDLVIAASGSDLSDYATLEQLQDSVELVTGLIPDTSDLATKAELQDNIELVTGLIPTVQLNSSNLVTSINNYPIYSEGGAGTTYTAGDGIDITNNIISVDNTVALKSDIPDVSDLATKAELQDGLELVTGLIPDVTNYATHAEVNNVSGAIVDLIPELPEDINLVAGTNIGITVTGSDIIISASGSDMSDYVTEEELIEAVTSVTAAIPAAQVQSNWNESDASSPAYIQNKPTFPSIEGLATVAQVSAVSGYLQSEIDNIPAQVQSDWTEDDTTDPAYIQNKPDQVRLVAGQNITIVDDVDIVTISASVPTVTGFATKEELQDGLELVTGLIPSIDGLATVAEVQTVSGYLQNEIENIPGGTEYTAGEHIGIVNDEISVTGITELVAGNAITITTSGVSAIISSTGEAQVQSDWDVTDSSSKAYIKNKPTIPDAQVQSNWNETNTSSKAYIQNKPTIPNYTGASGVAINNDTITLDNPIGLVAGDNITIEVSGVSAIISAQGGGGGGTTYTAGTGIDITSDVISIDNTVALKTDIPVVTGYIPYSASGVDLPNSNFKIEPDGQAYKSGSQSTEITIANETTLPSEFYAPIQYIPTNKTITVTFDGYSESGTPTRLAYFIYDSGWGNKSYTEVDIINNTATFNIRSQSISSTDHGLGIRPMNSTGNLDWSKLVNPKVAYTDTVSYNIPYITTTAGITDIQLVNELPVSPVSSVLYLIPET